MISVVVVYNRKEFLKSPIAKSLKLQSSQYELIMINNENNDKFESAAAALNHGGSKANCKFIMFIHQDVDLLDTDFLEKGKKYLLNDPSISVAGVAGMSTAGENFKELCKNLIFHGYPEKRAWGNKIDVPVVVQTLDECLLLVRRDYFQKNQFDEKTCPDWHFYGVDYCLEAGIKGCKVVALPLPIYHESLGRSAKPKWNLLGVGSKNGAYYRSLKMLLNKYKGRVTLIATTSGIWNTRYPLWVQRIVASVKVRLGLY